VPAATGDAQHARIVTLINPLGLHARSAADVVRLAGEVAVDVRIGRADGGAEVSAASLLGLLALGARGGASLRVRAAGSGAVEAVERVATLLGSGFGEIDAGTSTEG
jgi:phosphoenolpyruvate---glycerone phosphotransferase subunit DhaM